MSRNIWLVQSGKFRKEPKPEEEILGFSHIVDLDYMGAAEFEFEFDSGTSSNNPLYNGMRRIVKNSDNYDFFEITKRKDALGRKLYLYCNKDESEELIPLVREFAKNDYAKRGTGFCRYLKASAEALETDKYLKNFWWDIKNDFILVFGEEHKELIRNHVEVMRQQCPELFPKPKTGLIQKLLSLLDNAKFCK